jgi:type I restriction enzyme, S subunit
VSAPVMVRLRDLGNWAGGNTPSKANPAYWTDGTVPWVSPKDMKVHEVISSEDRITELALADGRVSLVPEGSVLFVTRSGILSHTFPVAITKLPVTINQDLKALTPKEGVSPKYVAYAIRGASQRILRECAKNGTTVASIETSRLLDFEISIGGLSEQLEIVAEVEKQFSRLDEAVANLQRVKANLRRYKASVLKDAVEGRLVATEAELARRDGRSFETGTQLLQRILETRRSQWKGRGKYKEPGVVSKTDFPALPDGWAWATIEDLTYLVTSGSRGWGDFYSDVGVLFIRAQDIKSDSLREKSVARVDVPAGAEGSRSGVGENDILVTITGANVTKSALVPTLQEQAFVSQHVALLKLTFADTASFVFNWIVSPANGRKILEKWAYGAGKPGLSLEQIRTLPVALPPQNEQHRIVAEIDRRLSLVLGVDGAVDANLKRAQALRQSTLSKAFTPVLGRKD